MKFRVSTPLRAIENVVVTDLPEVIEWMLEDLRWLREVDGVFNDVNVLVEVVG